MQSLRNSAIRAFGSVAKGHGAHDIKNPTADVTISLVLGQSPLFTSFEHSVLPRLCHRDLPLAAIFSCFPQSVCLHVLCRFQSPTIPTVLSYEFYLIIYYFLVCYSVSVYLWVAFDLLLFLPYFPRSGSF